MWRRESRRRGRGRRRLARPSRYGPDGVSRHCAHTTLLDPPNSAHDPSASAAPSTNHHATDIAASLGPATLDTARRKSAPHNAQPPYPGLLTPLSNPGSFSEGPPISHQPHPRNSRFSPNVSRRNARATSRGQAEFSAAPTRRRIGSIALTILPSAVPRHPNSQHLV